MNYYGGKELAESFRTVRKNTLAVAEDIPDDKYSFRPMPDTRSVGELFAHIAMGSEFQKQVHGVERRSTLAGFDFPALMQRMQAELRTTFIFSTHDPQLMAHAEETFAIRDGALVAHQVGGAA